MTAKGENAKQRRTVYKVVRPNRASLVVKDENELFYPKGKVVEANAESMGIFVFKTRKSAQDFIGVPGSKGVFESKDGCKVLRAEPLSRGYVPREIHSVRYGGLIWWNVIKAAPAGTMCYHKVRVLD